MITLYSTEGCHLCEMAIELCEHAGVSSQVEVIDIAFNDTLFSRYGVTIPVLRLNGNELNWPFDLQELNNWLEDNGITHHQ